jgi:splicing factor 3B subunit 3
MQSVMSADVFGVVRDMLAFRLVGGNRDYLVIASDSGKLVVLQLDGVRLKFVKLHEETYGRSGCRRIVPGQFLAVDPSGRAILVGAVEKAKLVYIANRDSSGELTISSPLEASKAHFVTMSACGVDVEFENPIFAAIEIGYQQDVAYTGDGAVAAVGKNLTFYELDLGLNHVTRKWTTPCDKGASMVLPVPGGDDGPGGVLVCCESKLVFMNHEHDDVVCPLPRRFGVSDDASVLIVASGLHKQKGRLRECSCGFCFLFSCVFCILFRSH